MDEREQPLGRHADDASSADESQRRLDLAMRLLAWQQGAGKATMRLLPGQLPDDLPLRLPLPADAHIVGAMTQAQSAQESVVTILIDAPHASEQCVQFYLERLEALGWHMQTLPHMRGGFVHVQPDGSAFLRFADSADAHTLLLMMQRGASAEETAIHIILREQDTHALERRNMGPAAMRRSEALIPPLIPPPGGSQQGSGGGGNAVRWQSNIQLETTLPVTGVMAHYDRLLERGGWRRHAGDTSGPVGWSVWSFADSSGALWQGTLLALSGYEHPERYLVLIQVETESDSDERAQGGFSFGALSAVRSRAPRRGKKQGLGAWLRRLWRRG